MRPATVHYLRGDEASLWAAAVHSYGGTVSNSRLALIRQLIKASKACGHWPATDDIALLVAENAVSALVTLKRRALMSVVAAPTFTADAGYAFNGTTQYINTGFVLSTMAQQMQATDMRAALYERTNVNSNGWSLGASATGTIRILPSGTTSTSAITALSCNNTTLTISPGDARGFTSFSRSGGGVSVAGWKNGVALTPVNSGSAQNTFPTVALYIGCSNNSGTAGNFRAATTIGEVEWGAPLGSTAAELSWYTALQAFMTAVGANV